MDVTEATWLARLGAGRKLKKWPRAEWGPAPGEAECACPEGLLEAGDGDGWANRSLV